MTLLPLPSLGTATRTDSSDGLIRTVQVEMLVNMGFDRNEAISALQMGAR